MNCHQQPQSLNISNSNARFTRGHCVERDPCLASRTLGLWDLTFRLPNHGDFELTRDFLVSEGFALYTDRYRIDTQITGSTPAGTFTVVMPLNIRGGSEGFGRAFSLEQVLAGFHTCVDVVFAEEQQILVVMLQRDLMLQVCTELELAKLEAACGLHLIIPPKAKLDRTRQQLLALLAAPDHSPALLDTALPIEVASVVVDLVRRCTLSKQSLDHVSLRRRGYERALEVIDGCGPRLPNIPQLCAEAGVSQRTLEYAFRDYTGMTPKRFLQYCRFWQLRKTLLTDESCGSVHDAASQLGIHEMGRMAAEYRHWFGELPSESLRRASPQNHFSVSTHMTIDTADT